MRMDRLTSKFQMALADAQSLAVGRDNQFIEPAHVLLALVDQQGGAIRPLLDRAGVNVDVLRSSLLKATSTFRASCSCLRRRKTRAPSARRSRTPAGSRAR